MQNCTSCTSPNLDLYSVIGRFIMRKYRITAITFSALVFFALGTIDKIIAQTKWDGLDFSFACAVAILSGITLYNYKNAL